MSSQDKKDLEEVRNDFISDGLRWSLDGDKKLVHLWRKLKRTEQVLRTQSHEINDLKKQQKDEMAGMQDFLSKIRNLSEEKEQLTQSLEIENEQLRKQVEQAIDERDAFVQENQAIAELLIAEGLQPVSGATPKRQVVEHLLQERTDIKNQLDQLTKEKAEVVKKLDHSQKELQTKEEELKSDLQSAQQSSDDVSKQLKSMEEAHNAEKAKLNEERDKLKADIEEQLGKLALMRAEIRELKTKMTTDGRAFEIETTRLKKQLEAMTNTQNELQASHESEVKRLHSDKKAVQRDLTSTKSKTKNLLQERADIKNQLDQLTKEKAEIAKKLDTFQKHVQTKEKEFESDLHSAQLSSFNRKELEKAPLHKADHEPGRLNDKRDKEVIHTSKQVRLQKEIDELKVGIEEHLVMIHTDLRELKSETATNSRTHETAIMKLTECLNDLTQRQDIESSKKALEAENKQLEHQLLQLQQQLEATRREKQSLLTAQQESIAFGIEPWKVLRENVELGKLIGGGGWGVVNEGKLRVAVKQFYPNIMSKQNLSRLKREMQILARIRHPNLLQFIAAVFDDDDDHDHDHEHNPPYIITELLDTSLRLAYEKKLLRSCNVLSIFYDTAKALDYLHRRHEPIIHRDVSSANVLLKRQPNGTWIAKLSDLGSANLAREAYTMNEGARVYCAPEAFTFNSSARSIERLTPKIDVYSYGIMLCEVATATFPDDTALSAMRDCVQREWPQLYQLIIACTRPSADQRPTMETVLELLKAFPPQQ